MERFLLLVAEDNDQDISVCRQAVERYRAQRGRAIDLVECKTKESALQTVSNKFDGAIIDLKLAKAGNEGVEILAMMRESLFRIPVAIMTGTPDSAVMDVPTIRIYKKGESSYDDILDNLFEIYDSGLTKIMGGRGLIERHLTQIYFNGVLPQLSTWLKYGKADSGRSEKALLRLIMSHLAEALDDEGESYYPEEMYILAPPKSPWKTGGIVSDRESKSRFVILTPACDLALREGQIKTERILAAEIEGLDADFLSRARKNHGEDVPDKKEKANWIFSVLPRNNYTPYYHFLPATALFEGGLINFRRLLALSPKEFLKKFEGPVLQISPFFTKDIVSRFSAYYSRQGQPDFDFDELSKALIGPA